jgi:peptidoglycan/LPS O-acetylase OafA/YrhL
LWEAFACVGICLGLIVLFRERFNSQGRFAKLLSDNAFAVYVFHPPILVSVSILLLAWHAHPLAKFAFAGTLAVVASFAAGEFVFRRIPGLKRIL